MFNWFTWYDSSFLLTRAHHVRRSLALTICFDEEGCVVFCRVASPALFYLVLRPLIMNLLVPKTGVGFADFFSMIRCVSPTSPSTSLCHFVEHDDPYLFFFFIFMKVAHIRPLSTFYSDKAFSSVCPLISVARPCPAPFLSFLFSCFTFFFCAVNAGTPTPPPRWSFPSNVSPSSSGFQG